MDLACWQVLASMAQLKRSPDAVTDANAYSQADLRHVSSATNEGGGLKTRYEWRRLGSEIDSDQHLGMKTTPADKNALTSRMFPKSLNLPVSG